MSETISVPMAAQRDIQTVTTEIRTLHRQAQGMILNYAIEIGRRLKEAKSLLEHGEWGAWLENEVDFSRSTANNFMKIFEEYGAKQVSLFGDANSQTIGNLPYTHALKLLAVPAEEREEFVEEHHVEDLSSRELDRLIKERDAAVRRAEESEKRELAQADALAELEALRDKVEEAASASVEKAQKEAQEAKAALEQARKDLALADGDMAVFKELFRRVQEDFGMMEDAIRRVGEKNAESAEKLRIAVQALVKRWAV